MYALGSFYLFSYVLKRRNILDEVLKLLDITIRHKMYFHI